MLVPFEKDLKKYLNKNHSNTSHRGFESLRRNLLPNNIYYKGVIKEINFVINYCVICKLKNNKIKITNQEKFKMLIFDRLKIRYVGDFNGNSYRIN